MISLEKKPTVAIALAVYNGENWLIEQIESILSQKYVSVTIFVSIDHSSDSSENICLKLSKKYKEIKILKENFKFGSGAKNFYHLLKSINLYNFDYFAFSDQDDIWLPSKIERALDCLTKTESHGYSSNLTPFNKEKSWILKKDHPQRRFDYLFQGASAGCTYVITTKAALLIQEKISSDDSEFSVDTSHDWLTYAICRSHNMKWFSDHESHILYRQHENNAYGSMDGLQGIQKKIQFIRSGWYRKHIIWMSQFLLLSPKEKMIINRIKRLNYYDRLYLSINSFNFRRSKKDSIVLSLLFIMKIFN
jgi:rhamnosyltransferase